MDDTALCAFFRTLSIAIFVSLAGVSINSSIRFFKWRFELQKEQNKKKR